MRKLLLVSVILLLVASCQKNKIAVCDERVICRPMTSAAMCADLVTAVCARASECMETPEFEKTCQGRGYATCVDPEFKMDASDEQLLYGECIPTLTSFSCETLMSGEFPPACLTLYGEDEDPDAGVSD